MRISSIRSISLAVAVTALGATTVAQRTIQVADTGATVRNWTQENASFSAVSRDGGETWVSLAAPKHQLNWRTRSFDPAVGDTAIPANLMANESNELFYVQFVTDIIPEYKQALRALDAEAKHYYPHQAYIVRMGRDRADAVRAQPYVRAVMELQVGHKLDAPIQIGLLDGSLATARYNIMLVDKHEDAGVLEARIEEIGGLLDSAANGGILVEATLTPAQVRQIAHENSVLWIDHWSAPEFDTDNARIQGGMDYVESVAGIDGKGMRGLVNEAIHDAHPEFAALPPYRTTPLVWGGNAASSHGTNTAGEIYAQGLPGGIKGMMPFGQMIEANSVGSARYNMVEDLQDSAQAYKALLMTQSWGGGRTRNYTSTSALLDDILFDFPRMFATNSQSNAGNPDSRPEAWAKNVCGIGGFNHFNDTVRSNDCWCGTGSTGPAQDGRVGVSFSSYYDSIRTTNLSSGYTNGFGGTSGATPLVNGLAGGAIQMFTEGLLGYPGGTWEERFANRPNLTTTRVMLAVTTNQLNFAGLTPSSRVQQGWGMPNLQKLYDGKDTTLLLDEEDVLTQGKSRDYWVWVKPGSTLKVSMHHLEPAAVPSAIPTRINSLDLSVLDFINGTTWWGNDQNPGGILEGTWSAPGGTANDIDIHENVFIQSPPSGPYRVRVTATAVRGDNHVETAAEDVDFALAIRGIGGGRDMSGMTLDMVSDTPGQFDLVVANLPSSGWVDGITMFSLKADRNVSLGNTFGVERDALSTSIIGRTPLAGDPFSFTTGSPSEYPNVTYSFPTSTTSVIQGWTLDAVIVLFDATGAIVDVSNVDRVTIQ